MSIADDVLAEALRANDAYRARLRRVVHDRTDDELATLIGHFGATNLSNLTVVAGLVAADIRIACNKEKKARIAWAEIEQEVGS